MRPLVAVVTLSLLMVSVSAAGPRETIIGKNAAFCDSERRACLRGTLTYYSNPRLLDLRSRVQKAEGPGLLKIRLVGENADGHTRRTVLEIRIRGRHSEIVNKKLITDHPDVDSWRVDSISFVPGLPPPETKADIHRLRSSASEPAFHCAHLGRLSRQVRLSA